MVEIALESFAAVRQRRVRESYTRERQDTLGSVGCWRSLRPFGHHIASSHRHSSRCTASHLPLRLETLAALTERIDFPALKRSLKKQIVEEYLKLTGKQLPIQALGKRLAVSVADSCRCPPALPLPVENIPIPSILTGMLNDCERSRPKGGTPPPNGNASLPMMI
jgi:hypothetical protein